MKVRLLAALVAAILVSTLVPGAPVSADRGEWPLERPITFCLAQSDGAEVLTTATFGEGGQNGWWYTTTTGPEFIGGNHYPPCTPPPPPDPGPQPADVVEYGDWSAEMPTCDVPVVVQTRSVTTIVSVLNDDETAWIPGSPLITTETQNVSLTEAELAACPIDPYPGPRPDDIVLTTTYDGDADCVSGTVGVISIIETTPYYLGSDNKWHLSSHTSTDRQVGSRDMTSGELEACQPDIDSPPVQQPVISDGSSTGTHPMADTTPPAASTGGEATSLPVTGAGSSVAPTNDIFVVMMGSVMLLFALFYVRRRYV